MTDIRWPIKLEKHEEELLADVAVLQSLAVKLQTCVLHGQVKEGNQKRLEEVIESLRKIVYEAVKS